MKKKIKKSQQGRRKKPFYLLSFKPQNKDWKLLKISGFSSIKEAENFGELFRKALYPDMFPDHFEITLPKKNNQKKK